jgi:hypothetical protein
MEDDAPETCKECGRPIIEIDNRGKLLRGCVTCNGWRDVDDNFIELSVEDLAALHTLRSR